MALMIVGVGLAALAAWRIGRVENIQIETVWSDELGHARIVKVKRMTARKMEG